MNLISKLFLFLLIINSISAQIEYGWKPLLNSPFDSGKHEDIFFTNENTGYLVTQTQIFKTTDAGESWNQVYSENNVRFRAVAFIDSLNGFIGKIFGNGASDSVKLLRTTDAGLTWEPSIIEGERPVGVCGIHIVSDSVINAVGRYSGPSFFLRSTNGGESWKSKNLSTMASMLIDTYFFHPDTGLAVGSIRQSGIERSAIFSTTNGGESWDTVFVGTINNQWCWKISFPSRNIGYVSVQSFSTTVTFIKTTDGGKSWNQKTFSPGGSYSPQGIGFVNDSVGFMGSYPGNSITDIFKTTNGGDNWVRIVGIKNVNRFRFLNDTLGYAAGSYVYKFGKIDVSSVTENFKPNSYLLSQNFPNPFNPVTTIKYYLPKDEFVTLELFSLLGRKIAVLVNEFQKNGENSYTINFNNINGISLNSGVYFYRLKTETFTETKKLILQK